MQLFWNNTPLANLIRWFKIGTTWAAFIIGIVFSGLAFSLLFSENWPLGICLGFMAYGFVMFSRDLAHTLLAEAAKIEQATETYEG